MDPVTMGVIIASILGIFLLSQNGSGGPPDAVVDLGSQGTVLNSLGLWDVSPGEQGGQYRDTYDWAFSKASASTGVPFAILKAHAVRESALDPSAFRQEPNGKASYGLMQILWWKNSGRFTKYGYTDDVIGDGSLLYDGGVNCDIAAQLWLENFNNNSKNLRDTINMYNTGVKESRRLAPGNYVNDVLKYYSTLINRSVTS